MQGEELVVDETTDGEGIEGLHEEVVGLLIVLVDALGPEVEELGHLSALMVAPQHVDRGGIVQLKGVQEQHHFAREGPSVHIVPQEQVLRLRRVPSHIQHLHEVVVLPMDVPHNGHWVIQ